MPLSETMTRIAGVVMYKGVPRGTCFRVTAPSEVFPDVHELSQPYLITAAHCLPSDPTEAVILMPDKDGEPHELKQRLEWRVHPTYEADPATGVDIAAARMVPEDNWWFATRIEDSVASTDQPFLGAELVYFGLLSPVGSMVKRGQTMVRSAILGAIDVTDVNYRDDPSGEDHLASEAHLIDCRSLGGFSGSPVFHDAPYPGPPTQHLPDMFRDEIVRHRPELARIEMLTLHHFFVLFGMLVAYADYDGVAVVLPFKRIREIVDLDTFVAERRAKDETIKRAVKEFRELRVAGDDGAAGEASQPTGLSEPLQALLELLADNEE